MTNQIDGPLGPPAKVYLDQFNEFNQTLVWNMDRTLMGVRLPNGTYTGVLRQMQMNQSDVLLIPTERSPETEVVEFGEILTTVPVVMMSLLDVREYPDHVLTQLFRFSIDIVILLFITMYVFGRVLSKSEGARQHELANQERQGVLDGIWHLIQMMLNQAKVSPETTAGRILVVLTAIAVLFWLQIWQNQMKTEMVAYDTSRVIESLDEALARNKTLCMTKTEAATQYVEQTAKQDPHSSLARLWSRAIFNTKPTSDADTTDFLLSHVTPKNMASVVLVISHRLLSYLEDITCIAVRSKQDYVYNFLIGREIIVDVPTGAWFSRFLSPLYKRILHRKLLKVREGGWAVHMAKHTDVMVREMIAKITKPEQCMYRSLDQFLSTIEQPSRGAAAVESLYDVFVLLCAALMAAFVVLMLEKAGVIQATSVKYLSRITEVRPLALGAAVATARSVKQWRGRRMKRVARKREQQQQQAWKACPRRRPPAPPHLRHMIIGEIHCGSQ